MPLPGRQEGEAARAAAEAEEVGRGVRQPGAQPAGPGVAHPRVAQAVVRLGVETGRLGVPVDTARVRHVTPVRHDPKGDTHH
ncbi:hypothetical protein GCM10010238_23960 [Streptomyces griseoviridis]|uniref:Uncharacterized protein n=1 Tax=Streptomyces griseoviridis TaxID=45398 RepID=A0A918GGK9_STRGD|nr:hypothetical protein GCM10010238_23960 [Streptomyces niveoruber]